MSESKLNKEADEGTGAPCSSIKKNKNSTPLIGIGGADMLLPTVSSKLATETAARLLQFRRAGTAGTEPSNSGDSSAPTFDDSVLTFEVCVVAPVFQWRDKTLTCRALKGKSKSIFSELVGS